MFGHRMQLPREVIVGQNVTHDIGLLCRQLGVGDTALIIAGAKTWTIAGLTVKESLEREGYSVNHCLVETAHYQYVEIARRCIQKRKVKFCLGVGGGKNIDVAKMASYLEHIPFISVPTAATHDGIASTNVSIVGADNAMPYSRKTEAPLAIVADTTIIMKAPYRYLASGCGDIVSNWTAVKDWKLAKDIKGEYYGEYAASLSKMSASLILSNTSTIRKGTEDSVRMVVEALISTGVAMAIAGSSRPASGSEHLFSHALDSLGSSRAMHGEQCGVGAIMMEYLHHGNWKRIRNALRKLEAPTDAKGLGITPKLVIKALTIAHTIRPERYTILGDGLSASEAREVATATHVIPSRM
ncbi:MAG: NAD(P)-dependent glycerol-1-phosphate dehydrogenase [Candidatus Ranarchaeia archaeon]